MYCRGRETTRQVVVDHVRRGLRTCQREEEQGCSSLFDSPSLTCAPPVHRTRAIRMSERVSLFCVLFGGAHHNHSVSVWLLAKKGRRTAEAAGSEKLGTLREALVGGAQRKERKRRKGVKIHKKAFLTLVLRTKLLFFSTYRQNTAKELRWPNVHNRASLVASHRLAPAARRAILQPELLSRASSPRATSPYVVLYISDVIKRKHETERSYR